MHKIGGDDTSQHFSLLSEETECIYKTGGKYLSPSVAKTITKSEK